VSTPAIRMHRWSRAEYDRMVSAGVLHPEARLELIDGEILEMRPQGSAHAATVQLAEEALRKACGTGYSIRVQMPLALTETSEPEPDLAVVPGSPRDYLEAHPSTAALVVEVAEASLPYDRDRKKRLYAGNGIPEYWILNLPDTRLEVYREPRGADYASATVLRPADAVCPAACPQAGLPVSSLLP